MSQKLSYVSGIASSSGNNWASGLVAVRVHCDDTPGTVTNNISVTLDNTDQIIQQLNGTIDTGQGAGGGSGWVYLTSDGSPLPVKEFSITVTGTLTWELCYIAV
jgi:hypothetical protein